MRKFRIGLRLHIFLSFLMVFVLSFGIIIISFNLVLQNYINNDATQKIKEAIEISSSLLNDSANKAPPRLNETKVDFCIRELVRPLSSMSSVYTALLSENYAIEYPEITSSIKERKMVQEIVDELNRQTISFDDESLTIIKTKSNATFYTYVINQHIYFGADDPNPANLYVLMYFDATPFLVFSERVNTILLIVLFFALSLTLLTSLLVSNSIIDSLRKLTNFASRIGSGDYHRQNFSFFDREFDMLANDMNIMAEKIDQADQDQKTFFQNASHELRTPLMSIQGYAEGIKYKVFEDEDTAADIIISESQRLTQMVENLLSISRIDMAAAGGERIPKSIIDLRDLLEEVTENIRGSALVTHKNLQVKFPKDPVYILGNENDLVRAFENILSNGFRYATSTVQVNVSVSSAGDAVIEISDDGKGIADELLPTIFDRFSKGDGGKHGIGLALVRAIVKEHNGSVQAGNRKDKNGALFTITLPASRTKNIKDPS